MTASVLTLDAPEGCETTDLSHVRGRNVCDAEPNALYLIVIGGPEPRVMRAPSNGTFLIGRAATADVRIEGESISRSHARLVTTGGETELLDLGSQNGTTVNGRLIHGAVKLHPMDVVGVGHASVVICSRSRDPTIASVYAELERLAASELPIHIFGETGTGKELAARAIHAWSDRASKSFIAVNCAALPESLIESELFGHERGAFSGAHSAKIGVFEAADGGTLLFDEIGETPLIAQAKLLRVLETRRITRVGEAGQERLVNVRVISSTNRDLANEVTAGRFRQDLYYRLSAASVHIPALRDRKGEILAFARSFLNDARRRAGRGCAELSSCARDRLVQHAWPGNVRELRNLMECIAVVSSEDMISSDLLLGRLGNSAPPPATNAVNAVNVVNVVNESFRAIDDEIRELESGRMREALRASGGNQKAAAAMISMPRRTFLTKLKLYGIS